MLQDASQLGPNLLSALYSTICHRWSCWLKLRLCSEHQFFVLYAPFFRSALIASISGSARMAVFEAERENTQSCDGGEKIKNGNEGEELNINAVLRDDDLQAVLTKLKLSHDRDACALVCKRWKAIQDSGRKSMRLRAGRLMLERVAARFSCLTDLDMSESTGPSFCPGWQDEDLGLVSCSFDHLERLNLNNCKGITDRGLIEVGMKLAKLQWLDVSDCKHITDVGVEKVASGYPGLRTIYLTRCELITDKALAALSQCRYLETLVLQGCNKIGDDGLLKLSEGCSSLQVLDLTKCGKVGDVGLKSIIHKCSVTLHTLVLEDCPQVGDASVIEAGECCQSLQILLLGGCRLLSDLAVDAYFRRHTNLRTLRVEYCLKLTDNGIKSIFANCPSLKILDTRCCSLLTDRCFDTLTTGNCLKELKISGCSGITSAGIQKVAASCPQLSLLEAKYCDHISTVSVILIGLALPDGCKVILDTQTLVF